MLDDVSFEVPRGRSLAIVGRTGTGKSTLAVLLARLLPTPRRHGPSTATTSAICRSSAVRAAIGYAQQDAFLFSTTVARNIGFRSTIRTRPATAEQIRDAAREAQVLDETLGPARAFDTVVGERGVQLSGGQKQRMALARALVSRAQDPGARRPAVARSTRAPKAAILDAIERQRRDARSC